MPECARRGDGLPVVGIRPGEEEAECLDETSRLGGRHGPRCERRERRGEARLGRAVAGKLHAAGRVERERAHAVRGTCLNGGARAERLGPRGRVGKRRRRAGEGPAGPVREADRAVAAAPGDRDERGRERERPPALGVGPGDRPREGDVERRRLVGLGEGVEQQRVGRHGRVGTRRAASSASMSARDGLSTSKPVAGSPSVTVSGTPRRKT